MDFTELNLTIPGLIMIFGFLFTAIGFDMKRTKQLQEHAKEHAKLESSVTQIRGDINEAHEKIRRLEERREDDHNLIVKMSSAIEYIREAIDEIKRKREG